MKTPIQSKLDNVTVTRIEPIDERIVTMALSVKVASCPQKVSVHALGAYAELLLSGTKNYTKEALDQYLRRHGIEMNISSRGALITFTATTRAANLPAFVHILEEIILRPSFPQKLFTIFQKRALEEIREGADNAEMIAHQQFTDMLFPGNSLLRVRSLKESEEDLKALTLTKIKEIKRQLLHNEWFVSVVGNESILASLRPLIETLRKEVYETVVYENVLNTKGEKVRFKEVVGKTNIEVRVGSTLPISGDHHDFIPLSMGLTVLGYPGGFIGRLMTVVRAKEGLTYSVYLKSVCEHVTQNGYWMIYSFFTARDYKQGIASIKRELGTLIQKGITQKELFTFKKILQNRFLLQLESNARRLRLYHNASLHGESMEQLERENERIASLTVKEVNDAIKKYLSEDAVVLSAAGPIDCEGVPF